MSSYASNLIDQLSVLSKTAGFPSDIKLQLEALTIARRLIPQLQKPEDAAIELCFFVMYILFHTDQSLIRVLACVHRNSSCGYRLETIQSHFEMRETHHRRGTRYPIWGCRDPSQCIPCSRVVGNILINFESSSITTAALRSLLCRRSRRSDLESYTNHKSHVRSISPSKSYPVVSPLQKIIA